MNEDICDTVINELNMLSAVKDVTGEYLPPVNSVQGMIIVTPTKIKNINAYADLLSGFVSVVNCRVLPRTTKQTKQNTVFKTPDMYKKGEKVVSYEYTYNTQQRNWAEKSSVSE